MKKIFLILFSIANIIVFAQGQEKTSIDWMSLEKAEKYTKKYNKSIFILFYRPGCDYCEKMKRETLMDPEIVKIINENFLPVMLDGKSKNPIMYNGKKYINDHPNPKDAPWRHNLFAELVDPVKGNYYWPNIVIINSNYEKVVQFPGFQPKPRLMRSLYRFL